MTSIATTAGQVAAGSDKLRAAMQTTWFKKLATTVAVAVFSGLFLPAVVNKTGRVVQDRQRERELKATMSEGIVQPLTAAVTRAGLFAAGLMSTGGPGSPSYPAVLEEWLAASSKAGAQVVTYVEGGGTINARLRAEWKPLFEAVTDYLRLSSAVERVEPSAAVQRIRNQLQTYYPAQARRLNWPAIEGPRTSDGWYDAFHELGYHLLAARDELLADVRSARLAGFTRHILDF
jgi:hypothetical protein